MSESPETTLLSAIRAAISSAYYETREAGGTMESAADAAAAAVMDTLDAARATVPAGPDLLVDIEPPAPGAWPEDYRRGWYAAMKAAQATLAARPVPAAEPRCPTCGSVDPSRVARGWNVKREPWVRCDDEWHEAETCTICKKPRAVSEQIADALATGAPDTEEPA